MQSFGKTQVQISPKFRFEGTKTQVQIVKTQVQIAETQVRVSLLRWGETKKRTKKSLRYHGRYFLHTALP